MATATKTATTKKRKPPVRRADIHRELSLEELAQQELGWDPRITVYVTTPAEMKKVRNQDGFFAQSKGPYELGGYKITQIGGVHKKDGDLRVVEVVAEE